MNLINVWITKLVCFYNKTLVCKKKVFVYFCFFAKYKPRTCCGHQAYWIMLLNEFIVWCYFVHQDFRLRKKAWKCFFLNWKMGVLDLKGVDEISSLCLFHRQQYEIVQFFADFFPIGHIFVHHGHKIFVVVPDFQV